MTVVQAPVAPMVCLPSGLVQVLGVAHQRELAGPQPHSKAEARGGGERQTRPQRPAGLGNARLTDRLLRFTGFAYAKTPNVLSTGRCQHKGGHAWSCKLIHQLRGGLCFPKWVWCLSWRELKTIKELLGANETEEEIKSVAHQKHTGLGVPQRPAEITPSLVLIVT